MREPLQDFAHNKSTYERPTQPWVCGWAREGQPCRVGPSAKGVCRARYECRPLFKTTDPKSPREGHKGDRWVCTRPPSAGGACATGPLPDGTCACRVPRCQPFRSLRHRRGLTSRAVAAFTFGLLLIVLGGPRLRSVRMAVLSPGALSGNHSAITACATCHPGSGPDVAARAAAAPPGAAAGLGASCTTCHQGGRNTIDVPHNIPPATLAAVTERIGPSAGVPWQSPSLALAAFAGEPPTGDDGRLPCVSCHSEHRGRDFDLTAMASAPCQACHAQKIANFAGAHPEFTDYPAGDRTISDYFEHGMHAEEIGGLNCEDCHDATASGEITVFGYDDTCIDCHGDDMRDLTPAFTGGTPAPLTRLTPFEHRPHLVADCATCHVTGTESNFSPITKSMCASCHNARRTSEECLTCHAYHGEALRVGR